MNDEYLNIALEEAKKGLIEKDGGPFGALIIDSEGHIISASHNQVIKNNDPTAHAEIMAIREACHQLGTYNLEGHILYTTCEPCPMCLSAIIWANIKEVYYACTKEDAEKIGFRDDLIYEYLKGNNEILHKIKLDNHKCQDLMDKYQGTIY